MMTRTQHAFWLLFGAALFTVVLFLASLARAQAQDAGPGPGPAAESVGVAPTQPSILAPPDAASDPGGFVSWAGDTFHDARKTGVLFSWGILALFAVLAAVWQRLKPKGDDQPSMTVAVLACAVCLVAAIADVVVGAGHFATVATTAMPVALALFMKPHVQRGEKAGQ